MRRLDRLQVLNHEGADRDYSPGGEAERAKGHAQASLSVQDDSPAVGLYERNGFERVHESDGGLVMLKRL